MRRTILTSLILAIMGLFLAGCGCNGECPIKKMFGGEKKQCPSSSTEAPSEMEMK